MYKHLTGFGESHDIQLTHGALGNAAGLSKLVNGKPFTTTRKLHFDKIIIVLTF
jgi:hypothetical protein